MTQSALTVALILMLMCLHVTQYKGLRLHFRAAVHAYARTQACDSNHQSATSQVHTTSPVFGPFASIATRMIDSPGVETTGCPLGPAVGALTLYHPESREVGWVRVSEEVCRKGKE